jgi:hypothetical protein
VLDRELDCGNDVTMRWRSAFRAIDPDCSSNDGCIEGPTAILVGGAGSSERVVIPQAMFPAAR